MNKHEIEQSCIEKAKNIFTIENIGAISYYLSQLMPNPDTRIQEDQFKTIVTMAELDGMTKLIKLAVESVNKANPVTED